MLTLNWVGSLGVRSEVDVSTHRYVVSEKIPVTTKAFLILHFFLQKICIFIVPLLKAIA